MGPIQSLDDLVWFLRRRAVLILVVALVGMTVSVIHALRQPHEFESTTVLQVQAPKISDALAPSTVEAPTARRLQVVEQQMMARDNLLALAEEFGLLDGMYGLTVVEKVALLREMIQIRPIEAIGAEMTSDDTISGVTITARAGTPRTVQAVTAALAGQLIDLVKEGRLERTQRTREFFEERVDELTREIVAMEREITTFKNENDLSLDGSLEFRRIEINTLQRAILDIERERLSLQGALDNLLAEPQLRVVQRRMEELRTEIDAYDRQKETLLGRSAELARAIEGVPEIENQLRVLEGQLERLENERAIALESLVNAETAHRLELTDQAEQLQVIEPAGLPEYPVAPGRRKLAAAGTVASLMLALALAYLMDLRRPVIRSAVQMERELGIRPAITVPPFASPYEAARSGRRARFAILSGTGLAILLALLVAVSV